MSKNEKYKEKNLRKEEKVSVKESYGNRPSWGENGTTPEERSASKYIKK